MFKYIFLFLLSISPLFGDKIERFLQNEMTNKKIPGMAVVVIQDGKSKFYHRGHAELVSRRPVKEDTLFELASITKVFTSTAVAFEVQSGRMDLKESVANYVPYLKNRESPEIKKVTLLQLLTHTGSLPRRMPPAEANKKTLRNDVLHYLTEWKPSRPVGTKYAYSNLGFGLVGYALEGERGESLAEIYQDLILEPLGMHSTSLELSRTLSDRYAFGYNKTGKRVNPVAYTLTPGSGALRSTSRDMEKFLAANMGLRGPENLLKAMKFARLARFKVNDKLSMGLAWQITSLEGSDLIDKNGGLTGSSSYIGFMPDKNVGVVILMNKAKTDSTKMGRALIKLIVSQAAAAKLSTSPTVGQ